MARLCLSASASRDVILPMTVLRRLDSLLEPTKAAVLNLKASLDKAKIINQDGALRQAAGQPMPSKASRSSISSFSRR